MRFRGNHTTVFGYTEPVYLEPHVIRLRPQCNSWQRLDRYTLSLNPEPTLLTETTDAEGNDVALAWFSDRTDSLKVCTAFEVETLRENPFDFLMIGEGPSKLPVEYSEDLHERLATALRTSETDSDPIREFVRPVMDRASGLLIPFLSELNSEIHRRFEVTVREHGDPWSPARTLREERAACRDLATLFMDCCRTVGIAARFVSGYQENRGSSDERYMHAWAEVYLPGGGWRGYDPTQGLSVSNQHVSVAASAFARCATPISGSFRGDATARPIEVEGGHRVGQGPSDLGSSHDRKGTYVSGAGRRGKPDDPHS